MTSISEGPFQNIRSAVPSGEPCFIAFVDGTVGLFDTMSGQLSATRSNAFAIPNNGSRYSCLAMNRALVVAAAPSSQSAPDRLVLFDLGLNQRQVLSYPGSRVSIISPSGRNGFLYEVAGGLSTLNRGIYRASMGANGMIVNWRIEEPLMRLPGDTLEGRSEEFTAPLTHPQPLMGGGMAAFRAVDIHADPVEDQSAEEPPPWWPPDWPWGGSNPETAPLLYSGAMYQAYTNFGSERGSRLYPAAPSFLSSTNIYHYADYQGRLYTGNAADSFGVSTTEGGAIAGNMPNPLRVWVGQLIGSRTGGASTWLNTFAFPGCGIGLTIYETDRDDFTSGANVPRAITCTRMADGVQAGGQLTAFFQGSTVRTGPAMISRDSSGNVIQCTPVSVPVPGSVTGVGTRRARMFLRRFPTLEEVGGGSLDTLGAPAGIGYPGGWGDYTTRVTWDMVPEAVRLGGGA